MADILLIQALGYELIFFVIMNLFWVGLYFLFRRSRKRTEPKKCNPFVSVIIPVYNKVEYVRDAIDSVLRLTHKKREIIVVNDGSTDGSENICREYASRGLVRLLDFTKNGGKAAALNAGVKAAKGDLILTVDGDSTLEPDALSEMVNHFSDKRIGAVAGVVTVNKFKGMLNRFQVLEYFQQAFQRMVQAFWSAVLVLPGPISLYTKSAIIEAGGFEHDTLVEDWDMTMKIHKVGYDVITDNNAKAHTFAPAGLGEWWRQRIRWSRGGIKIARKHINIFKRTEKKALKGLMFPLHIMWMVVPFIIIPTMIAVMMPSHLAFGAVFASFSANLSLIFTQLQGMLTGVGGSMINIYMILDQIIIDFVDLGNLNWVRGFGYLSGLAFLTLTYVSLKVFGKDFQPKYFLSVLLMPIYWMLMNVVFFYSLLVEVTGGKLKW
jgi:cellulose synthase/poly-beta-1,6-N-acetylglucosamine synthase-like glycosyltransferase